MTNSPLEAFKTDFYTSITLNSKLLYTFNLSSLTLVVIIVMVIYVLIMSLEYNRMGYIYIGLRNFFNNQIPETMSGYFSTLVFILVFVGSLNLIALIPSNMSFTAQLLVNLFITISIVLGSLFLGFNLRGVKFILYFFPTNVPTIIRPLLFFIEILSFIMRAFSMSIRLFANMVAGHSLLHILHSFHGYILQLSIGSPMALIGSLGVTFLGCGWLMFEVFVALLQAYVFGLLYLLYLTDLSRF